jgi:hypothetical protein
MKTKLTFLLSLTFLFLFSGSVYGGVIDDTFDDAFDREDGVVVLSCKSVLHYKFYYSINIKDKVIKRHSNIEEMVFITFEIVENNEVFIKGIENPLRKEVTESSIFISRHDYGEGISIKENWKFSGMEKENNKLCLVGDKKF